MKKNDQEFNAGTFLIFFLMVIGALCVACIVGLSQG
jgi:hypothetical protein